MPPRQRKDHIVDATLDRVLDAFHTEDISPEVANLVAGKIASLRAPSPTTEAKDFSLDEAILVFGLKFTNGVGQAEWCIEDIPETKDFVISPCLDSLMENHSKNFGRSREAVRRTALDFMLNECLTAMKGNLTSEIQATDNRAQRIPTCWDNIKVFGKISFSHMITCPENRSSMVSPLGTIVNGRVDRVIARVQPPGRRGSMKRPKRCLQPLLLVVQAENTLSADCALPELVVYLASLHQSRLKRNRSDTSVYNVASDRYAFIFVAITHDGILKSSRRFEVTQGDTRTMLGCLRYLLEVSESTRPPEKDGSELVEGDSDYESDLDIDNVSPPE